MGQTAGLVCAARHTFRHKTHTDACTHSDIWYLLCTVDSQGKLQVSLCWGSRDVLSGSVDILGKVNLTLDTWPRPAYYSVLVFLLSCPSAHKMLLLACHLIMHRHIQSCKHDYTVHVTNHWVSSVVGAQLRRR